MFSIFHLKMKVLNKDTSNFHKYLSSFTMDLYFVGILLWLFILVGMSSNNRSSSVRNSAQFTRHVSSSHSSRPNHQSRWLVNHVSYPKDFGQYEPCFTTGCVLHLSEWNVRLATINYNIRLFPPITNWIQNNHFAGSHEIIGLCYLWVSRSCKLKLQSSMMWHCVVW